MNLEPCPICENEARAVKEGTKWFAECTHCSAWIDGMDTRREAIEAWNEWAVYEAEERQKGSGGE